MMPPSASEVFQPHCGVAFTEPMLELAHRVISCDAAARPEFGVDRKSLADRQTNTIDPRSTLGGTCTGSRGQYRPRFILV